MSLREGRNDTKKNKYMFFIICGWGGHQNSIATHASSHIPHKHTIICQKTQEEYDRPRVMLSVKLWTQSVCHFRDAFGMLEINPSKMFKLVNRPIQFSSRRWSAIVLHFPNTHILIHLVFPHTTSTFGCSAFGSSALGFSSCISLAFASGCCGSSVILHSFLE